MKYRHHVWIYLTFELRLSVAYQVHTQALKLFWRHLRHKSA